ncbi:MAG: hypothetical protein MJ153_03575 [Clostridia bacterium]|nr:hypothetical protein [Clostridia bacterium]
MRKILTLVLTMCFCAGFASCGNNIDEQTAFKGYASDRYCSKSKESDSAIFLSLQPDGSVEGQEYFYNPDESSPDYEYGTIYGNLFNFKLSKLKKIDEYTYSAIVGNITYEYEPGTEEIDNVSTDDGNGGVVSHVVRNFYTAPLKEDKNKKVIIILPNTLIGNIPENCYTYLEAFGFSTEDKTMPLDTIVLYFEATGEAFVMLPN